MRSSLSVRETAFLLQESEMVVRRRIDAGALACVGFRATSDGRLLRRLDPASVEAAFPEDATKRLRRLLMGALLAGRCQVPTPPTRWSKPAPLAALAEALRG